MPYQFAGERVDYSDLASGRVFAGLPGHPAFPVRLGSEIFQRCLALRRSEDLALRHPLGGSALRRSEDLALRGRLGGSAQGGNAGRVSLYDPCCGSGYLLGTLAMLHRAEIYAVTGSDIDPAAVARAERNLALLEPAGLERRAGEIEELLRRYGKESHRAALASGKVLADRLAGEAERYPLAARAFQADALDGPALRAGLKGAAVDIVLTDVPYGQHSRWTGLGEGAGVPVERLLAALRGVLAPGGIAAIAADKAQKYRWPGYRRLDHFQVGKRRVMIFQLEPKEE